MNDIPVPRDFTMDDLFPKNMTYETLLTEIGLGNREIIATLINPIRKEPHYKEGRVTGFKSGLFGGGHYNYKNGTPMSYDSSKRHWIKKPKVHITYNCYTWKRSGAREDSDWVDIDNCKFQIIKS